MYPLVALLAVLPVVVPCVALTWQCLFERVPARVREVMVARVPLRPMHPSRPIARPSTFPRGSVVTKLPELDDEETKVFTRHRNTARADHQS